MTNFARRALEIALVLAVLGAMGGWLVYFVAALSVLLDPSGSADWSLAIGTAVTLLGFIALLRVFFLPCAVRAKRRVT